MRNIRVASVQFEHAAGDKQANLAKIADFVGQAAAQGVELIVFPECCITGYWFLRRLSCEQLQTLAEPVPNGPSSQALMALAKKHGMTIGAGFIEVTGDGKMYNTYVVAMPNGEFQRHRKIHTFISEHLSSGIEYTVFDTPHGCRAAVLTCYDNNIGENVRIVALKGAEILLAPHQTGGFPLRYAGMGLIDRRLWDNRHADPTAIRAELIGPKGREWLMRWLPSRAYDNGCYLVYSNGIGPDGAEIRTGGAMVLDPHGRVLAETQAADDDMVVATLTPDPLEHNLGRSHMQTRRPELYVALVAPSAGAMSTKASRDAAIADSKS